MASPSPRLWSPMPERDQARPPRGASARRAPARATCRSRRGRAACPAGPSSTSADPGRRPAPVRQSRGLLEALHAEEHQQADREAQEEVDPAPARSARTKGSHSRPMKTGITPAYTPEQREGPEIAGVHRRRQRRDRHLAGERQAGAGHQGDGVRLALDPGIRDARRSGRSSRSTRAAAVDRVDPVGVVHHHLCDGYRPRARRSPRDLHHARLGEPDPLQRELLDRREGRAKHADGPDAQEDGRPAPRAARAGRAR